MIEIKNQTTFESGQSPVISLLCSLKADLGPVDSDGRGAFHRLCKNDKIVNARTFLDAASEFLPRLGGDQQVCTGNSLKAREWKRNRIGIAGL